MPRSHEYDWSSSEDEPPRKKNLNGIFNTTHFNQGEIIRDISGKSWKLGKTIGVGGFGEIYEASQSNYPMVKTDYKYVAKMEKHTSGPLFVEINCYLKIGKSHMIEKWKKENKLKFLGMPHYVASGSCYHRSEKYRFLLLPKYNKDLGQILKEKKVFNIKTISNICIQILDVLEYIHSKGYIHSDIKASNIMLGNQNKSKISNQKIKLEVGPQTTGRNVRLCNTLKMTKEPKRNLRPTSNVNYIDDIPYLEEILNLYENRKYSEGTKQTDDIISSDEMLETENKYFNRVYLVDFGLASKFLHPSGEHKEFSTDERRAHAGTVLFCSRDAHKGVPSRRSDLESLAYNMVYWLTGILPWIEDLEEPAEVEKKKNRCFRALKAFLDSCFHSNFPRFVLDYFEYLDKLQYMGCPDYNYCRSIFKKAIKVYAYKQDSVLDFDNLEGWGNKQNKIKSNKKTITNNSFLKTSPLRPLNSNTVFKRPKLRKQLKNVQIQDSIMNWSKILTDPEEIIKQARERKTTESNDLGCPTLSSLDIYSMNPTSEMLNIYNKCIGREASPRYKGESYTIEKIDGYTPAMMAICAKIQEKKELEYSIIVNNNSHSVSKKKKSVRKMRRSVSPTEKVPRGKSLAAGKKESSLNLKKSKNVPNRRNYSLRG